MSDPAIAGYGVVDGPPLPLSPSNTVMANLSGAQAYPTAVTLAALSAALSTVAYQGTWNASTNAPTLVSNVGTGGQYYIVSVAGTTSLNGISDWSVGDWAIFNATTSTWQKIEAGTTTITAGSTAVAGGTASGLLWSNASVLAAGPATTDATGNVALPSAATIAWNADTFIGRVSAAKFLFGGTAVDTAPVAQTLSVQNTLAGGTADVAGANFTLAMSQGKGTGTGGAFVIQTAPVGSTGTAVNALVEAARFDGAGRLLIGATAVSFTNAQKFEVKGGISGFSTTDASRAVVIVQNLDTTVSTIQPGLFIRDGSGNNRLGFGVQNDASTAHMFGTNSINFYTGATTFTGLRMSLTVSGSTVLGSAAVATNATDGFLYAVSGAGTPTGTPTGFTGRVPIYVDTTNSQLWLYMGGAWKQPKTPAGAAVVTWQ